MQNSAKIETFFQIQINIPNSILFHVKAMFMALSEMLATYYEIYWIYMRFLFFFVTYFFSKKKIISLKIN